MELLWLVAIIVVWVLLQAVVLPKLGISTWMKPSCRVGGDKNIETIEQKEGE